MAENRYIDAYPVIGIRPTIAGRRGALKVRESLEEHTINMARAAALDTNGEAVCAECGKHLIKEWYNVTEKDQKAILAASTWNYAVCGYFRGGGFSSRFVTKYKMPCTMIRLNPVDGLGPMLQIAEGWMVALPDEVTVACAAYGPFYKK